MGYLLAEGTGACVVGPATEVGLAVPVGLAAVVDGRSVAVGEALPEWLAAAVCEAFAVPVFRRADVDDGDGENIAGAVEDGEFVHAETVAETRTIKVTQHTTVSLALPVAPGMVMRTFMKPPYMPGERRRRFPLQAADIVIGIGIGIGREYALPAGSLPALAEASPARGMAI